MARHPDPNSLTDLADFAVILRLGTGSLAAARKGHSRARHVGTTFTFLGIKLLRLRRAAHHLHAVLLLGGGQCSSLGASVRNARARIECSASPEGTILLGISATSGNCGRGARRGALQGRERHRRSLLAPLPLWAALVPRQPLTL